MLPGANGPGHGPDGQGLPQLRSGAGWFDGQEDADVNEYELSYVLPKSGAGVVKERVQAGSEQNARDLVRARFGQEVRIFSGRQTEFGGDRDDQRDGKR